MITTSSLLVPTGKSSPVYVQVVLFSALFGILGQNLNYWQTLCLAAEPTSTTTPAQPTDINIDDCEIPNTAGYILNLINNPDDSWQAQLFAQPCFNINSATPDNHSTPRQIFATIKRKIASKNLDPNEIAALIHLLSSAIYHKPFFVDTELTQEFLQFIQHPFKAQNIGEQFPIFKYQIDALNQKATPEQKQQIYNFFNPDHLTPVKKYQEKILTKILQAIQAEQTAPRTNSGWRATPNKAENKTTWTYTGEDFPVGTNNELVVIINDSIDSYNHLTTDDFINRGQLMASAINFFLEHALPKNSIDGKLITALQKLTQLHLEQFIQKITKDCSLQLARMHTKEALWKTKTAQLKVLFAKPKKTNKDDQEIAKLKKTLNGIIAARLFLLWGYQL